MTTTPEREPLLAASKNRLSTVFLVAILILAVVMRIAWPGITEFKYDEATAARGALNLLRDGIWPTHGVTSSLGIPHPPLTSYVLILPFAITRNPAFAAALMGALGVLAIWLTYLLGRRYFDEQVGLIAALLFTISPWAAFYSRKLWSQNIPAVTLLFILALFALVIDRKPKALAGALITLGALLGLHLGGVAFVGVFVLALAFHPRALVSSSGESSSADRRREWLIWGGVGLAGFLLLNLPYAMEFISGHTSLGAVFFSAGAGGGRQPVSHLAIFYTADIATGQHFEALTGGAFYNPYGDFSLPDLDQALNWTEVWLIILSMAYLVIKTGVLLVRRLADRGGEGDASALSRHSLILLWLALPVSMWAFSGGELLPHHFIQTYPAQLITLAIMLVDLLRLVEERLSALKPVVVGVLALWLVVLSAWHVTTYLGMLRFFVDTPNGYGHATPTRLMWDAAREARQLARPTGAPVVVHTFGDDPDQDGGAAEMDALLGDFDLYLIDSPVIEVYPARDYVWLESHTDGTFTVEARAADAVAWPGDDLIASLVNGVNLHAVAFAGEQTLTPGEPLNLTLDWSIWGIPPSPDDYSLSVQLFTADGVRWAQVDDQFLRTTYWHPGDRIRTTVSLPVAGDAPPDGEYHLVVVMYIYLPDGTTQNVAFLDAAGNPAGQIITIPWDSIIP